MGLTPGLSIPRFSPHISRPEGTISEYVWPLQLQSSCRGGASRGLLFPTYPYRWVFIDIFDEVPTHLRLLPGFDVLS